MSSVVRSPIGHRGIQQYHGDGRLPQPAKPEPVHEAGERQFQYGQKLADKMVEIDRLREEVHRQSVVIDSFKRDYPKEFEELMKGFVKG